jgi:hypothetical protein
MKTCKSCPQPARPCSSLCSTCWQKSPAGYGDDYHEMVGRYIEQADREAAAKEALPFEAGDDDTQHWDSSIEACKSFTPVYVYRGDRLTDDMLKGMLCIPVKQDNGKCITGKTATMLVEDAQGVRHVVLRRQLRKLKREAITQDENPVRKAG